MPLVFFANHADALCAETMVALVLLGGQRQIVFKLRRSKQVVFFLNDKRAASALTSKADETFAGRFDLLNSFDGIVQQIAEQGEDFCIREKLRRYCMSA